MKLVMGISNEIGNEMGISNEIGNEMGNGIK